MSEIKEEIKDLTSHADSRAYFLFKKKVKQKLPHMDRKSVSDLFHTLKKQGGLKQFLITLNSV